MRNVGDLLKLFGKDSQGSVLPDLSVPHRLAILYLMVPLIIWLVGWFQWWFGILAAALLILSLWQALSGSWRVSPRFATLALLFLAALWIMTTAAGGVFDFHNFDWVKHRLLFLEVARDDWPTRLATYLETPAFLRFYLGYYMVPGLIGRLLGLAALNWAVPVWTWCGVSLILVLFTRGTSGWKMYAAALICIFFSGMDIVRIALIDGLHWFEFFFDLRGWPRVDFGLRGLWGGTMGLALDYWSNMRSLMWVPQHFIAGMLYALLLIHLQHHARFLMVSGVVLATSIFWSPLIAIGLLPLVAALLVSNGIRPFVSWQNLLIAIPLAGLLTVYLFSGAVGCLPYGWIWEIYGNVWGKLPRVLPVIYLTDFLLIAVLIALLRPELLRDRFFVACLPALLILPLYYFGKWNDLLIRGTIPSLSLLSFFVASTIANQSFEETRRGWRLAALIGLVALMAIGAVTPLFDLVRANNDHRFDRFRYEEMNSGTSILQVLDAEFHNQYAAYNVPARLRSLLRNADYDSRTLERGELIVMSNFDVYLNKRRLVYIKETCERAEQNARFFLHTYPLNADALPGRLHDTLDFDFVAYGWWADGKCLAIRDLPRYTIGRITTGQFDSGPNTDYWIGSYYSEPYKDRLVKEAGSPLLSAGFTVYRRGNSLLYEKNPCEATDLEARFLLHVTPVDTRDLWDKDSQLTYDVFDFAFSDFGDRKSERCLAIVEIPDYPIKEIKTGQFSNDRSLLWVTTISLDESD